mgnify:CR=1 FL=1
MSPREVDADENTIGQTSELVQALGYLYSGIGYAHLGRFPAAENALRTAEASKYRTVGAEACYYLGLMARADNDEEEFVFVAGGILEVQPGAVTVLADTAIRGHDLDEAKATEAKRLAEEAMKNAKSDIDLAKAQSTKLGRAIANIILRKFSACASALLSNFNCANLLTPSTNSATLSPNFSAISSLLTEVSSITSWSSAAIML